MSGPAQSILTDQEVAAFFFSEQRLWVKLAVSLVFGKGILGNYNEKWGHLPFLLLPACCAWEDPGWLVDTLSPPLVWKG